MEIKGAHSQSDSGALAPPDGLCTGKACNCGRVPCGMYLFDHRMGEHRVCTGWGGCRTLREWLVHNLTVSENGLLNPTIDGFFIVSSPGRLRCTPRFALYARANPRGCAG
jgi:hypothetical protein